MARKLDNFGEQVWGLFARCAAGEELGIPFAHSEHGSAVSTCHALRAFRRALIDGEKTGWPTASPENRGRAAAMLEGVKALSILGPVAVEGGGSMVKIVPNWKKPIAEFLGRAQRIYEQEPASPQVEEDAAKSLERMKRLLEGKDG
jgi:hypothetical protein